MAKVVALANQKGGVGKTTTTHNLATGLAMKGYKTLMVDLDAQASLTISAGHEPYKFTDNIVKLMEDSRYPIEQCIYELRDNLYLIPSDISLAGLEMTLVSRTAREKILDKILRKIKNEFDYILIDCPPQLSVLTINALAASDEVVVPCKTDYLSYRGIEMLLNTVETIIEDVNSDLSFKGIIATLYNGRSKDDKEILEGLQSEYDLLGVIKNMVAAKNSLYEGKAIVELDPKHDVAKAYMDIVDIICN